MPRIIICRDPFKVKDLATLAGALLPLAQVIIDSLGPTTLSEDDIEIIHHEWGPFDKTNGMAVSIEVIADETPERRKRLEAAIEIITEKAEAALSGVIDEEDKGYVRVILQPARYRRF